LSTVVPGKLPGKVEVAVHLMSLAVRAVPELFVQGVVVPDPEFEFTEIEWLSAR
jgi:hypothetical protein